MRTWPTSQASSPHFFIPKGQNISSCGGGFSIGLDLAPQKFKMLLYCLSVIENMLTWPLGGTKLFTLLTCTLALCRLAQWRVYTEYCIIVNPSFFKFFRNRVALLRAVLVVTGKSKKTKSHIIRYAFRRECFIGPDILFFVVLPCNIGPVKRLFQLPQP